MKTAKEVYIETIFPSGGISKDDMELWWKCQDDRSQIQQAIVNYAKLVIDEMMNRGDGENGLIYADMEGGYGGDAYYDYDAVAKFKEELK